MNLPKRNVDIIVKSGENRSLVLPGVITKKSRLVSVHDGRPVAPYSETVTYEPRSGFSSNSLLPCIRRESDDSCAYIVQNPLYRD
uniref:Transposase n=1 Tax=Angiostrongylus cantonensis TaxID=6313 RepID=A0A0K0D8B9_ANGCA